LGRLRISRGQSINQLLGGGGGVGVAQTAEQAGGILPIAKSIVFFHHAKCTFSCQLGKKPMGYHYGD